MSEPKGTIYDLGYKRYVGPRRSTATRWRVIMRNQITAAWKKWWRYKLALGLAVLVTFIAGAVMYLSSTKTIRGFGNAGEEIRLTFLDGTLPLVVEQYCRFPAFILSLTLGALIIATDTQTGAFTFYYVRPVRPLDYVIGKVTGYGFLVATVVLAPLLALTAFRLGMSDDVHDALDHVMLLPKTLAVGALATVAYTTVPLAISALVPNRRYALGMWAGYYVIVGTIVSFASHGSTPAIGALDLQTAIKAVAYDLYDVRQLRGFAPTMSALTASLMIIGQGVVAFGLIWYQVSRDEKAGVGGSS